MIRLHRAAWLCLSLVLLLSLAACGGERVVYVVVTPTPEGATAAPATDLEAGSGLGVADVPLPPVAETAEESGEAAALPTAEGDEPLPSDASGETIAAAESAIDPLPADAGHLVFMGPYGADGPFHAFLSNADGTGLRFLSETLNESYFPNLSPDGSQVAMTASNEQGDPEIYLLDVASGELTNLTERTGQDIQPVWSPDGAQIAFVSDREGGDSDIWVMGADGSEPRRLARNPGEEQLGSWSPDGTQIAFSNRDELGESLWIMQVESGEVTRLTGDEGSVDSGPAWSPDGELIAFFSSADANSAPQIFTIHPDGSEREQLTGGLSPSVFPAWSPDGRWLAFTEVGLDNQLNMKALEIASNIVHPIPEVQGLVTTWRESTGVLADEGVSQGPKQSDVSVNGEVLEAAYRRGDPDAPVTIVEFSDYQCPFCQRWYSETLPQLEPYIEDGTVQLIFVDFPLNIHPQAPAASQAARCAGELGGDDAYWEMHDVLFESLNQWSGQEAPAPIFGELAAGAGLDGDALAECVESGRYASEVQEGLQEGTRLGVTGTPTFFVNGQRLVGAQPFSAFESLIQQQ